MNKDTGAFQSSLRLDSNHGAMTSPGGGEILIAGSDSVRGTLQPVFFAGRYNAASLQPIVEGQINVDENDGYTLSSEVSPDGTFVFAGLNSLDEVNLIAKYRADLTSQWGASLTYHGRFAGLGFEAYPLANGDVGFRFEFLGGGATAITRTNVLGVLNGLNGALKWSAVVNTAQTATSQDDFRFIFGPDSSLFCSMKTVSFLSPNTNAVRLARITPSGALAYSKTLAIPNAILGWQFYLGGDALLYSTFKEGNADRIQFTVLDENGNISGNTALNCQLRGSGLIQLTAAKREGTDFAFVRMECGFPGASPEQTLARINLNTGAMEMRKLPQPLPGVETYEIVGTPKGDALAPHNNVPSLPSITTAIVGVINQVGGGSRAAFYEIPRDGSFPACLPLSNSSATVGTALTVQLSDANILGLEDGASVASRAMPGMTAPMALPVIQAAPVAQTSICEDDPEAPALSISITRTGPATGEIRVPTTPGLRYRIQSGASLAAWADLQSQNGDGAVFVVPITFSGERTFYRAAAEPLAP